MIASLAVTAWGFLAVTIPLFGPSAPASISDTTEIRGVVRDVHYDSGSGQTLGSLAIDLDVDGETIRVEHQAADEVDELPAILRRGDRVVAHVTKGVFFSTNWLWQLRRDHVARSCNPRILKWIGASLADCLRETDAVLLSFDYGVAPSHRGAELQRSGLLCLVGGAALSWFLRAMQNKGGSDG